MKIYVKRFKNGKVSHYLTPAPLKTGGFAIASKNFNREKFEININYPKFDALEDAYKYLDIVFKEVL